MVRRKLPPNERQYHTSVGMPPEQYDLLRALARQRKRSVSFLVREAVDEYLARLGLVAIPVEAAS